jgi:hypothetical protein
MSPMRSWPGKVQFYFAYSALIHSVVTLFGR